MKIALELTWPFYIVGIVVMIGSLFLRTKSTEGKNNIQFLWLGILTSICVGLLVVTPLSGDTIGFVLLVFTQIYSKFLLLLNLICLIIIFYLQRNLKKEWRRKNLEKNIFAFCIGVTAGYFINSI